MRNNISLLNLLFITFCGEPFIICRWYIEIIFLKPIIVFKYHEIWNAHMHPCTHIQAHTHACAHAHTHTHMQSHAHRCSCVKLNIFGYSLISGCVVSKKLFGMLTLTYINPLLKNTYFNCISLIVNINQIIMFTQCLYHVPVAIIYSM